MKILWCWRCKAEVPMLDEAEYEKAHLLYGKAFRYRERKTYEERFKELLDYYREVTGVSETNPNAIMHHRIAQYGEPCEKCGKPYRTPRASFCAACGNRRVVEGKDEKRL
jgi:DNA-directed RNA polymerase subunit RPC12/RpoP